LDRCQALLDLCRRVDYAGVIAHQPAAVATLADVLQSLRQLTAASAPAMAREVADEMQRPASPPDSQDKSRQLEHQRQVTEALSRAGFGDRLGKLYCSTAERRQIAFRDTPHKLGLPQFAMVVAPDYAPLNGFHGVFVGAQEVFSCVLPLPAQEHQWQIRERHRFANLSQLVTLVGMLSAGFPVS